MDNELKLFIATLRCFIYSPDEVEATLTAEQLKEACEELLEPEDGDEVDITQVMPMTTEVEPVETIHILIRARNALIRTRIKDCYDLAKEVDFMAHALKYREDPLTPPYDYAKFIEIATEVLTENKEPI